MESGVGGLPTGPDSSEPGGWGTNGAPAAEVPAGLGGAAFAMLGSPGDALEAVVAKPAGPAVGSGVRPGTGFAAVAGPGMAPGVGASPASAANGSGKAAGFAGRLDAAPGTGLAPGADPGTAPGVGAAPANVANRSGKAAGFAGRFGATPGLGFAAGPGLGTVGAAAGVGVDAIGGAATAFGAFVGTVAAVGLLGAVKDPVARLPGLFTPNCLVNDANAVAVSLRRQYPETHW